ncbi:MazG nucleotide pyrophosphohydrolase domain-containing protein [Dictyobacter formicarum]|uniref:NTP pyrophosphohydrolase MazG-like domain-containing protein n=1 Tax=Dictyobacter formicarum TaxID=2778368 RepID=A0ABQ3VHQ9_9CHLR|nr:hypothetical protein KSZ_33690 [Dictyobacter formicarum]
MPLSLISRVLNRNRRLLVFSRSKRATDLECLGLTGESGEIADSVKKALFQGHDIDAVHIAKELGDVLWYIGLVI